MILILSFWFNLVVQSVLHHHPHILQLDGIKYELSLGLPCQEHLNLNKVILDMTVTIDCSQLPRGADTLNVLCSEFPGLRMQRGLLQHVCTLQGKYSDFQGAFPHMQMLFYHHLSRAKYPYFSGDSGQSPETKEDLTSVKKWDSSASQSPGLHAGDFSYGSTEGFGQEHYGLQERNEALTERSTQTKKSKMEEKAECRIDEADLEDLSIIMEADVFAYLQSIEEYKYILRHHQVQVVHVTSEGITTLYLQSEVPSRSDVKQNIRQAHKELRKLYQQQEGCLRKDQVKKSALYMPDGLTIALKKVQLVLPNVLFSYDQDTIYIVGEKTEVSQAKQMLLLGVEKSVMGSLTELPPSSSSSDSVSPESLAREQQVRRKSEVHTPVPPKLIGGSSTERKGDVGNTKEYKLAARFKSSGLLGREEMGGDIRSLTAKMDMQMLDLNSKSAPPTKSSLGTAGLLGNELTEGGTVAFRMTSPSSTGEDVLFKNQDPLSVNTFGRASYSTYKAKPTTPTGLTSTFTTGVKSSSVNALSASNTAVKTAAPFSTSVPSSKSSLRRANSFSGRPNLRDQLQNNPITVEPMINTHAHQRARSNSISSGRPSEDCPMTKVEAELTVSSLMWIYMKEVYCNQLDSMKSDLQMSEKQAGKGEMTVTLEGTDSSKVGESHRQLQNLVAMVASDFNSQEVRLAELGVVEKDKLFETCCLNVRSRLRKVILHNTKSSIFFHGPKSLCSEASDIFKAVYSGQKYHSLLQMKTFQEGVDQGATNASLSIQSTKESDQSVKLCSLQDTSQAVQSNSSSKSRVKSTKQKSATLERLENPSSMMDEVSQINSLSLLANARENTTEPKIDGPTSLPLEAHKKQDTAMTLKQTNLLSHSPSEKCVCGAIITNVKRTTCGVILCCDCLLFHSYCRVCYKEGMYSQKKVLGEPGQSYGSKDIRQEYQAQEPRSEHKDSKEQRGIQGTMTCAEMNLILPGYTKYTTAKITYCIPDGIQGDKDPYPGSPFKGGKFEAYLPLDPKGQSLLPYLKKAFHQGLTFTISSSKKAYGGDAKVNWGKIPHKTRMDGGKSGNGYPDSTFLTLLSEALVTHGIEGAAAISQDQAKS
ncbi:putative E3 ubiquitin-protein ligase DTX3 [Pimephales promelas]|nr:putative E3 ubiquitin-protein ligase DTX3 [Pimephales promelas]KAG1967537.1 putative E3 ubiquitin-protein ligase DTX3 [Pimephales promelas]